MTTQLSSRVAKTFVAQFLNTAIIILIINARVNNISFWPGKYTDTTPIWYENVGAVLLSTMIINIITIPTVQILLVLLKKCLRWWDRGCTSDERHTKKLTQASYEELYFGVEYSVDVRYSQILTLIFVTLLYSPTMPILYWSTTVQLVFIYFLDKFMVLRAARIPQNYSEKLGEIIRKILYYIIIVHLLFAIWLFGNSNIFSSDYDFSTGAALYRCL